MTLKLSAEEIDGIKGKVEKQTYLTTVELFYEGQIPHVAYLFIQGQLQLGKRGRAHKNVEPGTVIGLTELLENKPANYFAKIKAGSRVLILDRSTIKELYTLLGLSRYANRSKFDQI